MDWVSERVPGDPKRLVPLDDAAAKALSAGTPTNHYKARLQGLAGADAAPAAGMATAQGRDAEISEDVALQESLALNVGY